MEARQDYSADIAGEGERIKGVIIRGRRGMKRQHPTDPNLLLRINEIVALLKQIVTRLEK